VVVVGGTVLLSKVADPPRGQGERPTPEDVRWVTWLMVYVDYIGYPFIRSFGGDEETRRFRDLVKSVIHAVGGDAELAEMAGLPVDEVRRKLEESFSRAVEYVTRGRARPPRLLDTKKDFVLTAVEELMLMLTTYLEGYDEYEELGTRVLKAVLYLCGLSRRFVSRLMGWSEERVSPEVFREDFEYLRERAARKLWREWLPQWARQMLLGAGM
jgi:hypothetical protein